jgi:hypothetical protein
MSDRRIPVSAAIVPAIVTAVDDPRSSSAEVADVVAADAGLATAVLAVANSAAMGRPRQIRDLSTAVSMIGVDLVQTLAIAGATQLLDRDGGLPHMRRHAIETACAARVLAGHLDLRRSTRSLRVCCTTSARSCCGGGTPPATPRPTGSGPMSRHSSAVSGRASVTTMPPSLESSSRRGTCPGPSWMPSAITIGLISATTICRRSSPPQRISSPTMTEIGPTGSRWALKRSTRRAPSASDRRTT